METGLLGYLSAGGDLATMALVFIMWKFDRRLLAIEIQDRIHRRLHDATET